MCRLPAVRASTNVSCVVDADDNVEVIDVCRGRAHRAGAVGFCCALLKPQVRGIEKNFVADYVRRATYRPITIPDVPAWDTIYRGPARFAVLASRGDYRGGIINGADARRCPSQCIVHVASGLDINH